MKRRGHAYPEISIMVAIGLILLAIAVPRLVRGQWVAGGLWLLPLLALIIYVIRGWINLRNERRRF